MDMLFSFDTEDYVDPASNDALKALAESHTRHGIPACFGLVGEKLRFLQHGGRRDVVDALRPHEIAFHSDHHFMLGSARHHPSLLPAYVETHSWDDAVERLIAEESRGLADIERAFGRRPRTWLRTYGDWAPQVLAAYARLGIVVYAYGPPFHVTDTAPIWYCNQLVVANPRMMYEDNLHQKELSAKEKLQGLKDALMRHLENGTHRLGMVTHPTRFISDVWWEQPNWWEGIVTPPPRAEWQVPPRFPRATTEELLWIADEFLAFVASIPDIRVRRFEELGDEYGSQPSWASREQTVSLAGQVVKRFAAAAVEGHTFSAAEMLAMFAHALSEPDCPGVPVRTMIGPTEEPMLIEGDVTIRRQDLVAACEALERTVQDRPRVPAVIRTPVGPVGPASFLVAMARALAAPARNTIPIQPVDNLPAPLHNDDYEILGSRAPMTFIQNRSANPMSNTIRHGQLQYWTVKPAEQNP